MTTSHVFLTMTKHIPADAAMDWCARNTVKGSVNRRFRLFLPWHPRLSPFFHIGCIEKSTKGGQTSLIVTMRLSNFYCTRK